jgi:hypothetical protein
MYFTITPLDKIYSGEQTKMKEMGGSYGPYGEWGDESFMYGSVGMPEGKKQLGSPRCRREDNFKMELPDTK